MNITTTFKVRHIQEEHAFEIEFFHDDDIYKVRIMEFKNNQWHIKQSMELGGNHYAMIAISEFKDILIKSL